MPVSEHVDKAHSLKSWVASRARGRVAVTLPLPNVARPRRTTL